IERDSLAVPPVREQRRRSCANASLTATADFRDVHALRSATGSGDPAPTWWEAAICGAIIAMMTGALIGPVFAPTQEETPILRLAWLPVYAAIAGLLVYRLDRLWRAWPAMLAMAAVVGLAFASRYWSIDFATTMRRVIALAISC